MNSAKLRDSLELVGIAAVVLSLIFVAYEVRQNTISARAAAIQEIGQELADGFAFNGHHLGHQRARVVFDLRRRRTGPHAAGLLLDPANLPGLQGRGHDDFRSLYRLPRPWPRAQDAHAVRQGPGRSG